MVAKLVVRLLATAQRDEGSRRWVAKLVERLLANGSNPDISQKYKMGNISKGVANLAHQKNIQKRYDG